MDLWTNADFDNVLKTLTVFDRKKRHALRYACFRIQTEESGGVPADPAHHALADPLEEMDGFGGWKNFAITWDISVPNPVTLVKRKWSIYQEWNQTMERVSVEIPRTLETNHRVDPEVTVVASPESAKKKKTKNFLKTIFSGKEK